MNNEYAKKMMTTTAYPSVEWEVVDKKTDFDLAVWEADDAFYVNFKGTDSLIDWIFNFNFWAKKVPYKNMDKTFHLHRGFINLYHNVRDRIHQDFLDSDATKIIIMGHSLGGALATICYADFMWHKENKEKYSEIEIEGFASGSPRVLSTKKGFEEFDRLCKGLVRLKLKGDFVTRVPFKRLGFKHVSENNELSFGDDVKFPLQPKTMYQHAKEFYAAKIQNPSYKAKLGDRLVIPSLILFGLIYSGLLTLVVGLILWIF